MRGPAGTGGPSDRVTQTGLQGVNGLKKTQKGGKSPGGLLGQAIQSVVPGPAALSIPWKLVRQRFVHKYNHYGVTHMLHNLNY